MLSFCICLSDTDVVFLDVGTSKFPVLSSLSQRFMSLNDTTESEDTTEVCLYLNSDLPGLATRPTRSLVQEEIITKVVLRHKRGPRGYLKCGYSDPMFSGMCHSLRSDSYIKIRQSYFPFASS